MVNRIPTSAWSGAENVQSDELASLEAEQGNALVDEIQDRLAAFKALTGDDKLGPPAGVPAVRSWAGTARGRRS